MGLRILVVDDDRDIREALQQVLEEEGYQVATAENPIKAFEVMTQFVPDLIITDVMMPEMTGDEFVKCLRVTGSTTPVIVLTASGKPHVIALLASLAGIQIVVSKPVEIEDLFHHIKEARQRANDNDGGGTTCAAQ